MVVLTIINNNRNNGDNDNSRNANSNGNGDMSVADCQDEIRLHQAQIISLRDHINEQKQDQLRKPEDAAMDEADEAVFMMQQVHEQMNNNNNNGNNNGNKVRSKPSGNNYSLRHNVLLVCYYLSVI